MTQKHTEKPITNNGKAHKLSIDIAECSEYEPWHINWITRNDEGVVQAWEPDNTCIYTGTKLNDACNALNFSKYGDDDE